MIPQKYFIDCGTNTGDGFLHYARLYGVDDSWKCYTFEPNQSVLDIAKLRLCNYHPVFRNECVWTENKTIEFFISTIDSGGSSIDRESAEFASEKACRYHKRPVVNTTKKISVSAIDFHEFLIGLVVKDGDFVVVKMDIEGAEYPIIKHLSDKGSLGLIDVLAVEFHHWAGDTTTTESLLLDAGVKVIKHD